MNAAIESTAARTMNTAPAMRRDALAAAELLGDAKRAFDEYAIDRQWPEGWSDHRMRTALSAAWGLADATYGHIAFIAGEDD